MPVVSQPGSRKQAAPSTSGCSAAAKCAAPIAYSADTREHPTPTERTLPGAALSSSGACTNELWYSTVLFVPPASDTTGALAPLVIPSSATPSTRHALSVAVPATRSSDADVLAITTQRTAQSTPRSALRSSADTSAMLSVPSPSVVTFATVTAAPSSSDPARHSAAKPPRASDDADSTDTLLSTSAASPLDEAIVAFHTYTSRRLGAGVIAVPLCVRRSADTTTRHADTVPFPSDTSDG